ncbi:MAG: rRNA adenine N-6-methyltransferase family protein [Armatimonadota bacterium]
MQKEAARRYAGRPSAAESLKSLLIKPRFNLTIRHTFANTDFSPVPSVEIVLLHLQRRPDPWLRGNEYRQYKDFLCYAFSQRGKDIQTRLKTIFTPQQLKRLAQQQCFSPTARLADLALMQWLGIFAYYITGVSPDKRRIVEGAENRLLQLQNRLMKIHRNRKA